MTHKQLYEYWINAWKEDMSLLKNIVAPDCMVHQARIDEKNLLS